jgi:hypothetical protein
MWASRLEGMRRFLLLGSTAAAVLLALGAAACSSQAAPTGSAASHRPAASARRTTALTATVPSASRADGSAAASTTLASLAMSSLKHGYGMFVRMAGNRCEAESGVTTDGGARFRDAAAITTWNCADNPTVTKIAADRAGAAFAYGPKLFISPGPGQPWRASPQRGTVLAVSAAGNWVWMLLARCHGAKTTPDGCALHLVESTNSGRTWRATPTEPPAATRGSKYGLVSGGGQTWLLHLGTYTGYVLASPESNNRGKADSASLWYTGNGGRHWEKRSLPCGIDALSDAVSKVGTTLAAVCADEPSAGFQAKTTAISPDGGATWTRHIGCLFRPGCKNPLYDGYLGGIDAVSQDRIYLVGDRSPLLVTTDSGVRWHAEPLIGDTSGGTGNVVFFGRDHGLLTGQGGATDEQVDIFQTSNGGKTWTKIVPHLVG